MAAQSTLGQIYLWLLQPETAAHYVGLAQQLAADLSSVWWVSYTSVYMALAQIQLGQAQAARAELERAATTLGLAAGWPAQPPRNILERNVSWAVPCRMLL